MANIYSINITERISNHLEEKRHILDGALLSHLMSKTVIGTPDEIMREIKAGFSEGRWIGVYDAQSDEVLIYSPNGSIPTPGNGFVVGPPFTHNGEPDIRTAIEQSGLYGIPYDILLLFYEITLLKMGRTSPGKSIGASLGHNNAFVQKNERWVTVTQSPPSLPSPPVSPFPAPTIVIHQPQPNFRDPQSLTVIKASGETMLYPVLPGYDIHLYLNLEPPGTTESRQTICIADVAEVVIDQQRILTAPDATVCICYLPQ